MRLSEKPTYMSKILGRLSFYFIILFGLTLSLPALPSLVSLTNTPAFAQPSSQGEDNRPNILAIMGDDFGWSDIGSFGSEINTPNLDALAKEGKILSNYHTAPTCSPARVSFLTGTDWHTAGIGTMYESISSNQVGKPGYETYINDKVVTVAELLRDAGYHTLMSGKWHLSGKDNVNGTTPHDRGFEDEFSLAQSGANHFTYEPYGTGPVTFVRNGQVVPNPQNGTYSNDLWTNTMIDMIDKYYKDDKPLFMYLAFMVAHTPFQAPQEYIDKYMDVYSAGWDNIREQRFEKQKELGLWPANMSLPKRLPPNPAWDSLTDEQKQYWIKVFAAHAGMIENMDYNIGKVIQYLKDIGEYDNTLITFTSDNGSSEPIYSPLDAKVTSTTSEEVRQLRARYNNSIPMIGTEDSDVGYGLEGTMLAVSPFSGFKTTQYEGGIRAPLVIKAPVLGNMSTNSSINNNTSQAMISQSNNASLQQQQQTHTVDDFIHVTDFTPTFLDYAGVTHPDSYKGRQVASMIGKSIRAVLEDKADKVHEDSEIIAQELFGNSAVFMGDGTWKASKHIQFGLEPVWRLFDIVKDPSETTNVANQNPQILEPMVEYYDKWANETGIIPPNPEEFAVQGIGPTGGKVPTTSD